MLEAFLIITSAALSFAGLRLAIFCGSKVKLLPGDYNYRSLYAAAAAASAWLGYTCYAWHGLVWSVLIVAPIVGSLIAIPATLAGIALAVKMTPKK